MSQLPDDDAPKVTIGYRASPAQRDALNDILKEEQRTRPLAKLARACEYVMGLGVDLYWARQELGAQLDEVQRQLGVSRREALLEVLRAGISKMLGATPIRRSPTKSR